MYCCKNALLPLLLCLALLAGCGQQWKSDPPPEPLEVKEVSDPHSLEIVLPAEYLDLLTVIRDFPGEDTDSHWIPLLRVYEKASLEAAEVDWGDSDGVGFLFGITALDEAAFERYLCADGSGISLFAQGGDWYYAETFPSDVQFYRSGGVIDTESEEWKQWENLCALGSQVCNDIITRNGLTPYSDSEFWSREFTYDSNHAYVQYYPYFTFDGDKRIYETLVLSQPVRQGDGGIWCVERVYDAYGRIYPYYPDSGMASADYYRSLQADCDAGKDTQLLTPLGAAKRFGAEAAGVNDTPADMSFKKTSSLNTHYMETNRWADELVAALLVGRDVDDMELLECMGMFREDNWGVLGRFHYGSDWWPPLRAALEQAAVGEEQAARDLCMMRLYLSAHGQFEEAIAGFLRTQREADPDIFDQVLADLTKKPQSSDDLSRLQAALVPPAP